MSPPRPGRAAIFLDFDGTLVDIAPRPEDVVVSPDLKDTLKRLVDRHEGAVAVVTGRKIEEVDHLLGLPLAAAGMHGLERRPTPGDAVESAPPPEDIHTLRERLLTHSVLSGGVTLEDKGAGLALHYRAAPHRKDDVIAAMSEAIADLDALGIIHGKMVLEAKAKSHDKGAAVEAFLAGLPFAHRVPLFLGDDVTDEDGIRAAQAAGGHGIKVGDGQTAAKHRLANVPAVHAYLKSIAE